MGLDKFTPLEMSYAVTIRAATGSVERPVQLRHVKHFFDIDDDDSDYDEAEVIVVGPDKRGIVDLKAYDVFDREDMEFTVVFDNLEGKEDWSTEQVLALLSNDDFTHVHSHVKPKLGVLARLNLFKTREQQIEEATQRHLKLQLEQLEADEKGDQSDALEQAADEDEECDYGDESDAADDAQLNFATVSVEVDEDMLLRHIIIREDGGDKRVHSSEEQQEARSSDQAEHCEQKEAEASGSGDQDEHCGASGDREQVEQGYPSLDLEATTRTRAPTALTL